MRLHVNMVSATYLGSNFLNDILRLSSFSLRIENRFSPKAILVHLKNKNPVKIVS